MSILHTTRPTKKDQPGQTTQKEEHKQQVTETIERTKEREKERNRKRRILTKLGFVGIG